MNAKTLSGCAILAALLLPLPAPQAECRMRSRRQAKRLSPPSMRRARRSMCAWRMPRRARIAWQFREPIATLIVDGKTVGRHYAGPNWEMADGSAIVAKVAGRASGASAADIPLLKLEVVSRRGAGLSVGCHHHPAAQHQRRRRRGRVRAGRRVAERDVFGGLRILQEDERVDASARALTRPEDIPENGAHFMRAAKAETGAFAAPGRMAPALRRASRIISRFSGA